MDKLQKIALSNLADIYYQQFGVKDGASKKMYEAEREARIYINEQFGIHIGMLIDVTKPMVTDLTDFMINGELVMKAFISNIEFDCGGVSVVVLNPKGIYIDVPLQLVIESEKQS